MADAVQDVEVPVLPPRRETFLARYPRNLKLAAVIVVLAVLVLPWALTRIVEDKASAVKAQEKHVQHATQVQGADKAVPDTSPLLSGHQVPAGAEAALNEQDDRSIKLIAAPDSALTDDTPQGSLPRISEDGRQPWQVYARPFNTADKRPRVAIVIADLGLSRLASDAAIAQLPANVTLAFSVQSPVVGAWSGRARQDGHEVLISIPMEPFDYPRSDPGPNTLLTSLPNSDNIERFLWALRQSTGYVGITSLTGSRFTTDPEKMRPVFDILKQRGLMILDTRVAPHSVIMDLAKDSHLPAVAAGEQIDDNLSPEAIDQALDHLEKEARLNGRAVGVAGPLPIVIERLKIWLKDLPSRGIALAPVSAMVQ